MNLTKPQDQDADRQLESLLDEALKPQRPPADLAQRIVAETRPQLGGHRPVVGRIGPGALPWLVRIAAGVAIAAGLGVWLSLMHTPQPDPIIAIEGEFDSLFNDIAAADTPRNTDVDQELELLGLELELASAADWPDGEDGFDELVDYEFDSIMQNANPLF